MIQEKVTYQMETIDLKSKYWYQGMMVIRVSYHKWKGILKQFLYLDLEKILNRLRKVKGSESQREVKYMKYAKENHLKYLE